MRFNSREKSKAEAILKLLEGMSIQSAKKLLKKCNKALLQNKIGTTVFYQANEHDHPTGSSSASKSSENLE